MQTLQNEKAANEKSDRSARAGKNSEACGCDPVVGFDGAGQPQKADANVHMGREVSNKKTSACDSEKNTKREDQKEKAREDRASSLV
jgi:hypothetical protein